MSLTKPDVIDLIAVTPDRQRVALIVCDLGEITSISSRESALQQKLLTYVQFVSSGQFLDTYPEHGDRGVFVIVSCSVPPTDGMKRIEGVRERDCPEIFLPVEVTSEDDFRRVFGGSKPSPKKPWWKS